MYRVTRMSHTVYASYFSDLRRELSYLEGLLEAGDHVLLVNDLDDAAKVFDVETDEIVVIS